MTSAPQSRRLARPHRCAVSALAITVCLSRWLHFRCCALSTSVAAARSLLLLHRHAHAARCDVVVVRGHVQSPSYDARMIRTTTTIHAATTSCAARTNRAATTRPRQAGRPGRAARPRSTARPRSAARPRRAAWPRRAAKPRQAATAAGGVPSAATGARNAAAGWAGGMTPLGAAPGVTAPSGPSVMSHNPRAAATAHVSSRSRRGTAGRQGCDASVHLDE